MSNISDIKVIKSVVVTGATGSLGIPLCLELVNKGFKVFVFTRDVYKARKTRLAAFPSSIKFLQWHPEQDFEKFKVASKTDLKSLIAPTQQHEALIEALNGSSAVVHLAGKSMFSKRSSQKEIQDNRFQRIQAIKHLTYLLDFCAHKPALFLNASSILYYGKQKKEQDFEENVDESFSHGCDFWGHGSDILEKECQIISNRCGIPVVHLRLGFIIDSYSDFLKNQIKKCNANKASVWGNGKQWFPWIHIDDVIGIILFMITKSNLPETQDIRALNLVSPNPVSFEDFIRNLCTELKVKFPYLKTPEWYLKVKVGKISGFVCKCRKIVPNAVEAMGYKFQFLSLQAALRKEITMERRLSITSETAIMSKKTEISPAAIAT